jgi:hypothetical protein
MLSRFTRYVLLASVLAPIGFGGSVLGLWLFLRPIKAAGWDLKAIYYRSPWFVDLFQHVFLFGLILMLIAVISIAQDFVGWKWRKRAGRN